MQFMLWLISKFTIQQKIQMVKIRKNSLPFVIFLSFVFNLSLTQDSQKTQGVPFAQTNNFGYQADGSMDLTFAKSAQQKNEFIQTAGKMQHGTNFLEHLFQTDGDDNFHFTLPVEQQIAFYAYAYVIEQNTYERIKDVQSEPPIRMAVFEGNNLIVKSSFFFQKYIVLNGQKDKKYEIRIQTSGKAKLISLSVKLFVETADIHKTLQKDDALKYSLKTKEIKTELMQISNKFGVSWIIDQNNLRHSVLNVRRYYHYELLEMLIVGVASYIQLRTLFKLLKGNSIIV